MLGGCLESRISSVAGYEPPPGASWLPSNGHYSTREAFVYSTKKPPCVRRCNPHSLSRVRAALRFFYRVTIGRYFSGGSVDLCTESSSRATSHFNFVELLDRIARNAHFFYPFYLSLSGFSSANFYMKYFI